MDCLYLNLSPLLELIIYPPSSKYCVILSPIVCNPEPPIVTVFELLVWVPVTVQFPLAITLPPKLSVPLTIMFPEIVRVLLVVFNVLPASIVKLPPQFAAVVLIPNVVLLLIYTLLGYPAPEVTAVHSLPLVIEPP